MSNLKKPNTTNNTQKLPNKSPEASKDYKDPTGKREEIGRPKNSGYAENNPLKK